MKKSTIRWRIFKYNLTGILLLMALTAIIFNIVVGRYFERSITGQMERIANRAEETALLKGPEFFMPNEPPFPIHGDLPLLQPMASPIFTDVSPFYFMLDQSLREPLSVLDSDYILLDKAGERIAIPQDQFFKIQPAIETHLKELLNRKGPSNRYEIFKIDAVRYIAVVKPVSDKNTFGLGWIILFSSLEKVDRIQNAVNIILLSILIFSSVITVLFSSHAAQIVCAPFAQLDRHIRILAERKFGQRLTLPVDEELQGLVDTINHLSEMLEKHDKAQKTFLQNVSHEFRTPLMVIQSHAEGITHHVVEPELAAGIILEESRRLTGLVENLLYLSRLNALEEVYEFCPVELNGVARDCVRRMEGPAQQDGIVLDVMVGPEELWVYGDKEKLSRALSNLVSNGIRHGASSVTIGAKAGADGQAILTVQDDGDGVDNDDLPHLFDRFFRGQNGKCGLGLAIVKAVADRHSGTISVENAHPGALFKLSIPMHERG